MGLKNQYEFKPKINSISRGSYASYSSSSSRSSSLKNQNVNVNIAEGDKAKFYRNTTNGNVANFNISNHHHNTRLEEIGRSNTLQELMENWNDAVKSKQLDDFFQKEHQVLIDSFCE